MSEFLVVAMDNCKWCDRVKTHLTEKGHTVHELDLFENPHMAAILAKMQRVTVPQVFQLVGNHDETVEAVT